MSGLFKFGPGVKWPGVAKAMEEMGELQQPLGKLVMVDGRDEVHWSGPLRQPILDEAADVAAAVEFLVDNNYDYEDRAYFQARKAAKLRKFEEWHRLGEEP